MANAHTSLVNACISYINARGGYAMKMQTGVLPVAGRYVHAGRPGAPDVVAVMPNHNGFSGAPICGRMVAVEVKTGSGRLSKIQAETHKELSRRGALVLVVRSITDLEQGLAGGLPLPLRCSPARWRSGSC